MNTPAQCLLLSTAVDMDSINSKAACTVDINTNSVKSIEKATQLKATIHYSNPDILFIVETKLDSNY